MAASLINFTEKIRGKLFQNHLSASEVDRTHLKDFAIREFLEPNLKLPINKLDFLLNIDARSVVNEYADEETQKKWRTAAFILLTILRIERFKKQIKGGNSIKKAIAFLEETLRKNIIPEGTCIATNVGKMREIWMEYRSSVHLMLPYWKMMSGDNDGDLNMFTPRGLTNFLIYSDAIQKELSLIKPKHGERAGLVDLNLLWVMPSHYKIQSVPLKIEPFTPAEVEILEKYRSP